MSIPAFVRKLFSRPLVARVAAVVLAGCATVPDPISTPVGGPTVPEAQANAQTHTGAEVRWGGTISEVQNLEKRTVLTVVARPTTRRGEPLDGEASTGRFLAEFDRFLDPEVYKRGRRVTVVGRFTGIRSSPIDEHVYDYPVIQGRNLHLWEDYARSTPRYPGPYYHPYRYPYWHYPHPGFHRYPWWWY